MQNLAIINIFKSYSSVGTNNIVTMDFSPLKRVTTKNKFRNNERYYNNMNQAGVNPDAGRGSLPKELKKENLDTFALGK